MTAGRCSRLWEVGAARDGRLSGQLLLAHRAHLTTCDACTHEEHALHALARDLRGAEPEVDEVALRRLRQVMLERAYESSRTRPPSRVGWAVASLAGALAVAAVVWSFATRPVEHDAPSLSVTAGTGGASWTRRSTRDVEHVDLSDGVFSLVVHRRPNDRRVIVRVPEGEIEDFGTAFDVHVSAGHTTRVAVREGAVVFRRRGVAPLRLSAGMAWSANGDAAATRADVAQPAAQVIAPVTNVTPLAPPVARAPHRAGNAPRGAREHAASAAAPAPAGDGAAEDAAYLRVLALLHEGRAQEAQLAAMQYLQRFPDGFRRVELQRVAQAAAQPSGSDL